MLAFCVPVDYGFLGLLSQLATNGLGPRANVITQTMRDPNGALWELRELDAPSEAIAAHEYASRAPHGAVNVVGCVERVNRVTAPRHS